MGYIFDTLKKIRLTKSNDIYNKDGKLIGDYIQKPKQINDLSCPKKILIWMSQNPYKVWTSSDFQKSPNFIGYEAPTRIGDLKRAGYIIRDGFVGRFAIYKITEEGMKQAYNIKKELGIIQ